MSLYKQVLSGVGWTVTGRIANQFISLLVTIMLVRILAPEDFGHLLMVGIIMEFAELFATTGFGQALIQTTEPTRKQCSTIYWISILIGILLTIAFIMLAPYIASYYENAALIPIAYALSTKFLLNSVPSVHIALLQKQLKYAGLIKLRLTTISSSGLLAIVLAMNGFGVWSLVAQQIFNQLLFSLMIWRISDWRPGLQFSLQSVRNLLSFGINIFGFNIINFWARNVDDLLIGKYFGAELLGFYNKSYSLMLHPTIFTIGSVAGVMFPALSRMQEDTARVKRAYIRAINAISFLVFPAMAGLFLISDELVLIVFGEKWLGMIEVLKILCLVGILQTLMNPVGWIYMSQGRTDLMFRWGLVASLLYIITFVIGVSFGTIESVAFAYLIINTLLIYPTITIPGKLIGMRFIDVLSAVYVTLFSTAIMVALVIFVDFEFLEGVTGSIALGTKVLTGMATYLSVAFLLHHNAFVEIRQMLSREE